MTISPVDPRPTYDLSQFAEDARASIDGSSGAQIAALLVESARDDQKLARESRSAEEKQLKALNDRQVECLLSEAAAVREAGWTRGTGMMVSGALQVTGAALGLEAGGSKGDKITAAFSGEGRFIEGGTNILAAEADFRAATFRAEGTRAQNQARQSERHLDDLSRSESDSSQTARDALAAARNLIEAETQANQAAIYLRA